MTISARINRIMPGGRNLKAIAAVTLGGVFVIHNVRVIDGRDGLFAAMPGYVDRCGEFRDHCFPVTAEFNASLNEAVTQAYRDACEALQQQ